MFVDANEGITSGSWYCGCILFCFHLVSEACDSLYIELDSKLGGWRDLGVRQVRGERGLRTQESLPSECYCAPRLHPW